MKTAPIRPAGACTGPDAQQQSDASGRGGFHLGPPGEVDPIRAQAQAHHTFVAGNGLPTRWKGRPRFVVLETAFGLGHNFLATWDAWQRDPQRCTHLHYVALEKHPPLHADLQRAHCGSPLPALAAQLLQAWPPLTPNIHVLAFELGRVNLLLGLGDVDTLLPALRAPVDAFFLHGLSTAPNHAQSMLWVLKALSRLAAPGATLAGGAHTPTLQRGLATSGFEALCANAETTAAGGTGTAIAAATGRPPDLIRAVHKPRPAHAGRSTVHQHLETPPPRTAVVVGAGLAGAAAARALAQQGLQVTVLEQGAEAASQGSGNVAGLFHGTVNADDGTHARVHRAAALMAARTYADAIAAGVPGQQAGLLRLEQRPAGLQGMQALVHKQGWPASYVQALSADEASERAGVRLAWPAWFYPGGGWISPPRWVRAALATPGVQLKTGCAVAVVQRQGAQWQALDLDGRVQAQADVMVLAHTQAAQALQHLGHPPWPLEHTRGQVSLLTETVPGSPQTTLRLPLAGDGYAVQLDAPAAGAGAVAAAWGLPAGLLCGATSAVGFPVAGQLPEVTAEDHQHNLLRLQRLMGDGSLQDPSGRHNGRALQGRAAWRLNTNDRLPIAGAMPLPIWPAGQRQDQARLLPREPGLFVLTALGARGLTLAPLMAQLVAAQACGLPWPLEQDLADAVDPARWRVRAARVQGP